MFSAVASTTSRNVARVTVSRSRVAVRRWLSEAGIKPALKEEVVTAAKPVVVADAKKSWWTSAEWWGFAGALAGWGISGSAIYDAATRGPEVISLTMTPVLIVYSSLFAWWSWVVIPRNLLLMGCHVTNVGAQLNQLRRGIEHKVASGEGAQVQEAGRKAAIGGVALAGSLAFGPAVQRYLVNANLGVVSSIAAAPAGPFTVHFWAPMSKWLISGASFFEFNRPTEKISLAQYSALTMTGFFFSRYALLVKPINYNLCSVNVALFVSSVWHLGRKINADFISPKKPAAATPESK